MKAGTKVSIKKVGAVASPKYPTPMASEYVPGGGGVNDGKSLPLDYESLGVLVGDIEVGRRIYMDRTHRNGVAVPGALTSSPVQSIQPSDNGMLVFTENSLYLVVSQ